MTQNTLQSALPILDLKDACLTLKNNSGSVQILRDISLRIDAGDTVGLIGPSGSGKSSLLMIMGGLERATSGSIQALGQDLNVLNEDELARFRRGTMGVVFQSFHLIPTMTALENVATPLELAGERDAFDRAAAELEAVGLVREQQRVALARALAPRPRLLLADEPTGNLDASNGQMIMDLMFDLRDRYDITLVMVTHAPELAARCNRIIPLRDGRIDTSAQVEAAE